MVCFAAISITINTWPAGGSTRGQLICIFGRLVHTTAALWDSGGTPGLLQSDRKGRAVLKLPVGNDLCVSVSHLLTVFMCLFSIVA